jgi:hypothetical protein
MVITLGLMEEGMLAIGRAISWMSSVSTLGLMEGCTRASTKKIRSTDSGSIPGLI